MRLFRHAALLAASLFGLGAAQAQLPDAGGHGQPALNPAFDSNGVNLPNGSSVNRSPAITIGAAGGLSYSQVFSQGQWRHSVAGGIDDRGNDEYLVFLGEAAELFTESGGVFTPKDASASTLVYSSATGEYTYTIADGTQVIFDEQFVVHGRTYGADTALVSEVLTPAGERTTYHYKGAFYSIIVGGTPEEPIEQDVGPIYRLQSVTNNRGYQLHIHYQLDVMTNGAADYLGYMRPTYARLLNNAVDYCSPQAFECTGLTQTWPTLTISEVSAFQRDFYDTLNRKTSFHLNGNGQVSRIDTPERPNGAVSYGYIGNSPVTSVTIDYNTWSYAYSVTGDVRTTTMTDPSGRVSRVESDVDTGRILATVQVLDGAANPPVELRTEYAWTTDGLLDQVTAPEGDYTTYTYDSRANVTGVTYHPKPGSPEAAASQTLSMTASYPSTCSNPVTCNRPTAITDTSGRTTTMSYDAAHGGVRLISRPAPTAGGVQPQERHRYELNHAWYKDSSGSLVQSGDPIYLPDHIYTCRTGTHQQCNGTVDQHQRIFRYGSTGAANNLQLTIVKQRGGDQSLSGNTSYGYDSIGNLLTVNPPLFGSDNTTHYRYDAARQLVGVIGPDPDGAGGQDYPATRTVYDDDGRAILSEFGTVTGTSDLAWTAFAAQEFQTVSYDAAGQVDVTTLFDSLGVEQALIQYSYDASGRVECVAQRMNPAAYSSLPSSACTLGTAGVYGPDRIRKNEYDGLGRVDAVITALGTTVEATEMQRGFADNGQLAWIQDGNGNQTEYLYDGFGRLSERRYPNAVGSGANPSDSELFTYFPPTAANEGFIGQLSSSRTRADSSTGLTFLYSYDLLGRPTTIAAPGMGNLSMTYDNHGRILTLSQGGETITSTYNSRGWLASQTGANGTVSYAYNQLGQRTRLTWPDSFYVDYAYNTAGAPLQIRENGTTSGAGLLADFTYDDHGRRTAFNRGNGVTTNYSFDPTSRLQQLSHDLAGTADDLTLDFGFNPAGQITSRTTSNTGYVFTDHVNFDETFAYNGLNQITSITGRPAPVYDDRGNMTSDGLSTYGFDSLNRLTSVVNGGVTTTLAYDPLGRLHSEQVGSTVTEFLYDGQALIAEFNAVGTLQRRYVHGPGADAPIVEYAGSGTSSRSWLIADERGSIIAHTDGAGANTATNTYDEYGAPGAGNTGRFGYTGQVWLASTGLYHYKARAYNPELGRFLQTDPIGYAAGMNMYAYVGGDPMNLVDPSGLTGESQDRVQCTGTNITRRDSEGNQYCNTPFSVGGGFFNGGSFVGGGLRGIPVRITNGGLVWNQTVWVSTPVTFSSFGIQTGPQNPDQPCGLACRVANSFHASGNNPLAQDRPRVEDIDFCEVASSLLAQADSRLSQHGIESPSGLNVMTVQAEGGLGVAVFAGGSVGAYRDGSTGAWGFFTSGGIGGGVGGSGAILVGFGEDIPRPGMAIDFRYSLGPAVGGFSHNEGSNTYLGGLGASTFGRASMTVGGVATAQACP